MHPVRTCASCEHKSSILLFPRSDSGSGAGVRGRGRECTDLLRTDGRVVLEHQRALAQDEPRLPVRTNGMGQHRLATPGSSVVTGGVDAVILRMRPPLLPCDSADFAVSEAEFRAPQTLQPSSIGILSCGKATTTLLSRTRKPLFPWRAVRKRRSPGGAPRLMLLCAQLAASQSQPGHTSEPRARYRSAHILMRSTCGAAAAGVAVFAAADLHSVSVQPYPDSLTRCMEAA